MKPGEIVTADAGAPAVNATRRARLPARNAGRLPVYIGSHFELQRLSDAIELDRSDLAGARLALPAGATLRIEPGETVELDLVWD